jgi:ribosomal protein S18 acetylase RimI-like enzyme
VSNLEIRIGGPDELAELIAIDDDACTLYAEAGVSLSLPAGHPFAVGEQTRWRAAAERGRVLLAVRAGAPVGFCALGLIDGAAYIDQLSVRRAAMRSGVGSALVELALGAPPAGPIWLTTYSHLPWNRPWYERLGFRVVAEERCGPEMLQHLEEQRAALPLPAERVAMLLGRARG